MGAAVGVAGLAAQGGIFVRSLVPNVSYDSPDRFKVGLPESFADGLTLLPDQRLFVHRDGKAFRALSAVCTHLGCTVRAESFLEPDPLNRDRKRQKQSWRLSCPCHGSRYEVDGSNVSGPAPFPLPAYRLSLAVDDGQLVVDVADTVTRTAVLVLE
jgi:menaquinol-cytochrome c reductase iron-sulfur subunit